MATGRPQHPAAPLSVGESGLGSASKQALAAELGGNMGVLRGTEGIFERVILYCILCKGAKARA